MVVASDDVLAEVRGQVGCITLNRPRALNAISLGMIRTITARLLAWRENPRIQAVAIRGMGKTGPFGVFCAGGDIRFFHQAVGIGNPELEDFFTEEYALNHLIHNYPKPTIAFMDGVVMGGGMGLSQGGRVRVVTEQTQMAMPETHIGLFPDVGGGYFLSRCPGRVGEWLALSGAQIGADDAVQFGLADVRMAASDLPQAWDALGELTFGDGGTLDKWVATHSIAGHAYPTRATGQIDHYFSLNSVPEMILALEADPCEWAQQTAVLLRKASPLMLHVTLEQIGRSRTMNLADDLRMERDMVRRCFTLRPGPASETMEGIRALAVDKDRNPRWNPARIEDVTPEMVSPFFQSPWPAHAHPLRHLA